jgi:endonuclease IV
MQQPVKERIAKMREEIAQISEANRQYLQGGKKMAGSSSEQERRLQRLQEILDELLALTDWKKL